MLQIFSGNKNFTKGISIIEILVVIAIMAVSFSGLLGIVSFSLSASSLLKQKLEADFLAQDTMEAVRNFRDGTAWSSNGLGVLTAGSVYFAQKTADVPMKWILTPGTENTGIFSRKVVFEKVFRDSNSNIASSGTEDVNTKKATVTVSWQEKGRSHSVELITYFMNWR